MMRRLKGSKRYLAGDAKFPSTPTSSANFKAVKGGALIFPGSNRRSYRFYLRYH